MRPEDRSQLKVIEYLQDTYPQVLFHSDRSSGGSSNIGLAKLNKRFQFDVAMPDLYIFEASRGFHGLALEMKKPDASIYLKDRVTLSRQKHIQEQAAMLERFRKKGWMAEFAIGEHHGIEIINNYFKE